MCMLVLLQSLIWRHKALAFITCLNEVCSSTCDGLVLLFCYSFFTSHLRILLVVESYTFIVTTFLHGWLMIFTIFLSHIYAFHAFITVIRITEKDSVLMVKVIILEAWEYQMGPNDNPEKENPHPQNFRVFMMIRYILFLWYH